MNAIGVFAVVGVFFLSWVENRRVTVDQQKRWEVVYDGCMCNLSSPYEIRLCMYAQVSVTWTQTTWPASACCIPSWMAVHGPRV